jgi:hypothetical protein
LNSKKTRWEEYKDSLGDSRPWHLLNYSNYVNEDVAQKRFNVCLSCPYLRQVINQCAVCKCLMKNKTKLKQAECPLGKWHKEIE